MLSHQGGQGARGAGGAPHGAEAGPPALDVYQFANYSLQIPSIDNISQVLGEPNEDFSTPTSWMWAPDTITKMRDELAPFLSSYPDIPIYGLSKPL